MLDGPLDIIATISPSCSRFLARSSMMRRTCGVYSASKCTSSTKMKTTRPADVHRPARRRQHDALGRGSARLGRRQQGEGAPAVHHREGGERLRHAVLEHREVVLGERRDEAAIAVAGDDVGGHRGDRGAERRLPGRRRCLLRRHAERRQRQAEDGETRARAGRDGHPPIIRGRCGILDRCPARTPHPTALAAAFSTRAAAFGGLALTAPDAWLARLAAQPACAEGPWGDLVRVLPLTGAGARDTPLGEMVGGPGLDARLFTDLSTLTTDALVTPAAHVYVRTAAPRGLTPILAPGRSPWVPPPGLPARASAPPASPPRRSRWAPT